MIKTGFTIKLSTGEIGEVSSIDAIGININFTNLNNNICGHLWVNKESDEYKFIIGNRLSINDKILAYKHCSDTLLKLNHNNILDDFKTNIVYCDSYNEFDIIDDFKRLRLDIINYFIKPEFIDKFLDINFNDDLMTSSRFLEASLAHISRKYETMVLADMFFLIRNQNFIIVCNG